MLILLRNIDQVVQKQLFRDTNIGDKIIMRFKNCLNLMIKQLNKRKKDNKGVTMMAAIVIMTIMIIFSFALILAAYTYYSSQNKNVASMRCAEAATSLSLAIEKELTYKSSDGTIYPERNSHLYKYLRYNLFQNGQWPYYAPSVSGHDSTYACRYYNLKYNSAKYDEGIEGMPGNTSLCMYWIAKDNNYDYDHATRSDRDGVIMVIEVTCETAGQSYTVKSEYELETSEYGSEDGMQLAYIRSAQNDKSVNPLGNSAVSIFPALSVDPSERWTWKLVDME